MFDKSVLQGLKPDEAKWLFHHFRINLPPVFFTEILGDVAKPSGSKTSTGTGIGDAKSLANKVDHSSVSLNVSAGLLLDHELRSGPLSMDGRPVLHAERVSMGDGKSGAYIDQIPSQRILDRWREGNFSELENELAKLHRQNLKSNSLEVLFRMSKSIRNASIKTHDDVARAIQDFLFHQENHFENLSRWLAFCGFDTKLKEHIIASWKKAGRKPSQNRFPFICHFAKIEAHFLLGVSNSVITTRASNQTDMEYIKYLPFCEAFCSGDLLHQDLFPHFAQNWQTFLTREELKLAMREITDHWASIDETERKQGSYTYADFPPTSLDNAATKLFDKRIPNWRTLAKIERKPLSEADRQRTYEGIKPFVEAIKRYKGEE